ncbi:MAG: S8 family serine peptidase [Bacteroidetes bacterium]|nr:S8 family serine peptidase [Bacteroidota bacterium]
MTLRLLLVFLILPVYGQAQQRHWIFFESKPTVTSLSRLSVVFPDGQIEEKLATGWSPDWYDYPVDPRMILQIEQTGAVIHRQSRWLNAVSVTATADQLSRISQMKGVAGLEPVKQLVRPRETMVPVTGSDGLLKQSPGLDYGPGATQIRLTGLDRLHRLGITGRGIRVGVQDAGTKWRTHEALLGATVLAEYDFVEKDTDVTGDDSHGTAVFSLMAANLPGKMIGGTFGSEFLLTKTEYSPTETQIEEDNWVAGIEWLESMGVDIMNSSLGYTTFDDGSGYTYANGDFDGQTTKCTIAADIAARDKNLAVFVAAGNEGNLVPGTLIAPSDGFYVFSSGAVRFDSTLASFSSSGPTNDGRIKPDGLSMGSGNLIATNSKLVYASGNGTSYASPLSASAGALILSVYPELTPSDLNQYLRESADRFTNPDNRYGHGVIHPLNALYKAGPAVSNTFTATLQNGNLVLSGFLAWNRPFIHDSLRFHFHRPGVADQSFTPVLSDSALTVTIPNQWQPGDTVWFSLTGAAGSQPGQVVSFNWPTKPEFRRYLVIGQSETTAKNIRRGSFKPVIDTVYEKPDPDFTIGHAYPNPFNPSVSLKVTTTRSSGFQLQVFDITGRLVSTSDGVLQRGVNYLSWNPQSSGYQPASGIYFLVVHSQNQTKVRKAVFLK